MAYKKRRVYRRRRVGRTRRFGKSRRYRRVSRRRGFARRSAKLHYFKRVLNMPGVFWNGNSSTNSVFGSMWFSLSGVQLNYSATSPCFSQAGFKSMPSYTEFSNLFDKYSIRKVVVKWRPRANVTQGLGSGYVNSLYFNTVLDYDDDATTFSQDDLLQRGNVRYKSILRNGTTILTPAVNQAFYNSTLTTGYGQKFKPWLDTSSPDVPHYGIKFFAPGTAGSSDVGFKMDISVTMYYAFKQVK